MNQAQPPQTPQTPATPSPEAEAAPPIPAPANDDGLLRRALEGLLFITDRPLSAAELGKIVGVKDQDRIVLVVTQLQRELELRDAGYRLLAVAEGWQMATRPELAPYLRKLFADRATMRLSTAAQETLSIVAYKQPLTRAEIEEIRGVEVIAALETLLEKRLVKVVGRKETVGRPLMYGTTSEFLRHFGLLSLEDLPPINSFTPAAAAVPEVPADSFVGQTEESVMAEALSVHPAGAVELVEPAGPEPFPETRGDAEGDAHEGPLRPK
ncbi:MAG: SMC-Scp complex subunit ScpB [Elusimicrobia bacterium GWC2_65_9]|nr:MAG: SMC-Scp complex subunit ScpB [Elusimicrobia bacterium GWA2_66_18]OGR74978.1 MAG: SMC-Scp complex subunit ScpB [Elusimicrobia bacterium GWC2_65_9]